MPPIPQPKTALPFPRLEEPGWLPLWISATPFRHPFFLLMLAIPPLAHALHGLLSIVQEPFQGEFDGFLHGIKDWSWLISPMFVYCAWRKTLFVLNRRIHLDSRATRILIWLLIPFLALQLWWFQVGEAPTERHGFSPTIPRFFAGPAIGLAMGLLHVQAARQKSLLGFLTLVVALSWVIMPISLEMATWTSPRWGGGNNWFTVIPFLGSAANGLLFGLAMAKMMITSGLESAYLYLPFVLGCAFIEIKLRDLPLRSSLISLLGILAFLPFFHEWENYWID